MQNKMQNKMFIQYALAFGCVSIVCAFMPLFLQDFGFSETQIGLILSCSYIVSLFAMPFWGYVSDRSKNKNNILKLTQSGASIAIFFFIVSKNAVGTVISYVVFSFFYCVGIFLTDAIVMQVLKKDGGDYGKARLGGTIGYAIVGAVAGVVANVNFNIAIMMYIGIAILEILCLTFLVPKVPGKIEGEDSSKKKGAMRALLKNKKILTIAAFSFLIYINLNFYASFYGIFLRSLVNNKGLVAISLSIAALSEIPFFLFAQKIEDKIGLSNMMLGALCVIAVRFAGYFLFPNVYAAMGFQLLHGFGNTVMIYCMVKFMFSLTPPEYKSTGQSLAGLTGQFGLPGVIATQVGGFLVHHTSVRVMFLCCSIFIIAIFAGFLLFGKKVLEGEDDERNISRKKRRRAEN